MSSVGVSIDTQLIRLASVRLFTPVEVARDIRLPVGHCSIMVGACFLILLRWNHESTTSCDTLCLNTYSKEFLRMLVYAGQMQRKMVHSIIAVLSSERHLTDVTKNGGDLPQDWKNCREMKGDFRSMHQRVLYPSYIGLEEFLKKWYDLREYTGCGIVQFPLLLPERNDGAILRSFKDGDGDGDTQFQ
ncbi:hypothetical protein Tco_0770298 [Tanacetum coccineum]|uniref:Uncharacterized protein n=1 Tax=Tanacetum coccineum TaxID=301880 RepID=A0ABQ4ZCU5_9ASTR